MYRGFCRGVKLTAHLCLVLRLGISTSTSAVYVHDLDRDNFTLLYRTYIIPFYLYHTFPLYLYHIFVPIP